MKKSISTFLKHPTKDNTNRSANPPVTRASTILFNSMQELVGHERKIKANKKISYYSKSGVFLWLAKIHRKHQV